MTSLSTFNHIVVVTKQAKRSAERNVGIQIRMIHEDSIKELLISARWVLGSSNNRGSRPLLGGEPGTIDAVLQFRSRAIPEWVPVNAGSFLVIALPFYSLPYLCFGFVLTNQHPAHGMTSIYSWMQTTEQKRTPQASDAVPYAPSHTREGQRGRRPAEPTDPS